jgi:hypothetical protein
MHSLLQAGRSELGVGQPVLTLQLESIDQRLALENPAGPLIDALVVNEVKHDALRLDLVLALKSK